MKMTNNGYTIYKINNIYEFPELQKILCVSFAKQYEKFGISTGEPFTLKKENLYGFYTTRSIFLYDIVKDRIEIRYKKEEDIKYYNTLDETVKDLLDYKKTFPKESLQDIVTRINEYKELGVDWNGYRSNPVDHNCIGEAIRFINYLYDKINLDDVRLSVYPIADGGNEVKRPSDDSRSIVGFTLENGIREINLEITSPKLHIEPIIFEHNYKENNSSLHWPKEFAKYNNEYTIDADYEKDEFVKEMIKWIQYEI